MFTSGCSDVIYNVSGQILYVAQNFKWDFFPSPHQCGGPPGGGPRYFSVLVRACIAPLAHLCVP